MKLNFKEMFDSVSKFTNEHSPEIATGVGIACMFGATATAVVVTAKTMNMLAAKKEEKLAEICPSGNFEDLDAEEQQEYDNVLLAKPTFKDAAKVGWKWWLLPSGLLAAGTGCILYSDREQAKRISSLMTKVGVLAFKAAEAKDYKEAAKEILGEEKEKEIDDRAAKKSVERRNSQYANVDSSKYPHLAPGNNLYQEYNTGLRFYANWDYLESCLNKFNLRMVEEFREGNKWINLYEWLDILGLTGYTGRPVADRPGCGEDLAFRTDRDLLYFNESQDNAFQTEDKINGYVIRFNRRPEYRDDLI